MAGIFRQLLIVLFPLVFAASGCESPETGINIPSPQQQVTPAGPEDPQKPEEPEDPSDKEKEEKARLARIGKTPVIEVYYTEYTDKKLFPSAEEIRNFTIVNVGHGRFRNKQTGDGGIVIADESLLRKFVALKSSYPELKVKLMIGGWGKNADGFSMMARDEKKRAAFVQECVKICKNFGVDGFDIDWEYPTYAAKDGNYVNGADPSDWQNFVTLFKEMREAMPDKILSYAASDSGKYTDNYNVLKYADYINVMTYSMGNPPYHNAPLYRSSITKSRSCAECIDNIFHTQQKIPYDRMNFGVAFYGHGDEKSGGTTYPGTVNYSMLEEIFFNGTCDGKDVSGKNIRIWDNVAKVPYLGNAAGKMYASYEDIESVNCKVEYLKSRKMLGAMAWEYREDDAKGTLRHALKHAMDGNPDKPGALERPAENKPSTKVPVMGSVTKYTVDAEELSGLCLKQDKSALWGVGDNGSLYSITFDGKATQVYYHDADMEDVTLDPRNGNMYVAIEGSQKVYRLPAPNYNDYKTVFYVQEAVDGKYGNSGLEGMSYYKDGKVFIGSQWGAYLWVYDLDTGNKISKVSLETTFGKDRIEEVGGLCYDPETNWLWNVDSELFLLTILDFDNMKIIAQYDISKLAGNPESVCVDHEHSCVWVGDDTGSGASKLLKISFSDL